jgi:hypothetical protein
LANRTIHVARCHQQQAHICWQHQQAHRHFLPYRYVALR